MKKIKLHEKEEGSILFNIDPIIIKQHYEIDYIHSYAQEKLMGTQLLKLIACFVEIRLNGLNFQN